MEDIARNKFIPMIMSVGASKSSIQNALNKFNLLRVGA